MKRFQAAYAAGFSVVEINTQDMFDVPAVDLRGALNDANLKLALFNMRSTSRLGEAAQPGKEKEFEKCLQITKEYCIELNCKTVHCMAGDVHQDTEAQMPVFINNLKRAAEVLGPLGVTVCIEPLNERLRPNYFLKSNHMAAGILSEVGSKHVKLLFDFYHTQIIGGDLTMALYEYLPATGHLQLAGVPDRHEPDNTQEVNYDFILAELDKLEYNGYLGLEYTPRRGRKPGATEQGLGWLLQYGVVPRAV